MKSPPNESLRIVDFFTITIGCALYGLGLVLFNIPNKLSEGGITGITLILRALIHINPSYSIIAINLPLIIIGYHFLGKRTLIYTIYGTIMLSLWLFIWQLVPLHIDIHHDMFIAGILAGISGGLGSGLIYRFGGTTGGTDIIAKIMEKEHGVPMGQTLFALDVVVLVASLCYIDILHMMYTLLAAFVFSRIVNFTQVGSYKDLGLLIISDHAHEIADTILNELDRGASLIPMQGAYSKTEKVMLYCVVAQSELQTTKKLISNIDQHAFTSIIEVNEALGEGFH